MKVALVHDYLSEFGGAERVLRVLADMYPEAPIYTAFVRRGSVVAKAFADRRVVESRYAWLIKYFNLHSPLRFLLPRIWRSFDLSEYDVVITSCSAFIARGFATGNHTRVIAYCHTPPRFLYGYTTPSNYKRHWWGRLYAMVVNKELRQFDFESAQEVGMWIANSEEVKKRIAKFYRKEAMVVHPPIEVERYVKASQGVQKQNYFFIASRLVGAKGLEEAAAAAKALQFPLVIAGEGSRAMKERLLALGGEMVKLLGLVSNEEVADLYARAKGFLALSHDEDFGMTVVEAMAGGTPVIAYKGGGYLETVVEGETGVFVTEVNPAAIEDSMRKLAATKWSTQVMQERARKFSRERFEERIRAIINPLEDDARITRSRDSKMPVAS